MTQGIDVLRKLETLETRKEGIFVMPKVCLLGSVVCCANPGAVISCHCRRPALWLTTLS